MCVCVRVCVCVCNPSVVSLVVTRDNGLFDLCISQRCEMTILFSDKIQFETHKKKSNKIIFKNIKKIQFNVPSPSQYIYQCFG